MNPVLENILSRRSFRSFTSQPIEQQQLQDILTAGTYAPSGKNSQTRRFTVLRTPQVIRQLEEAMAAALATAQGRTSYNMFHPVALVLVSDQPNNPNAAFDCACALENMFLQAHSLGIGSCWINQMQYVYKDSAIRKLLDAFGIPEDHYVYGIASMGFPSSPAANMDKSQQVIHFVD